MAIVATVLCSVAIDCDQAIFREHLVGPAGMLLREALARLSQDQSQITAIPDREHPWSPQSAALHPFALDNFGT
jgi:hypothetical protein